MIAHLLGIPFLITGAAFALIGSIGVVRLPDFYSRTHAASKLDTLGLGLFMIGLAILNGADLDSGKLLLIVVFVGIANPVAAHALGRAALRARLAPWVRPDTDGDDAEDGR